MAKETDNKVETKPAPTPTEAEQLWNRIKDLPFEIFALPNQKLCNYAERVPLMEKVSPNVLHLKIKIPAVVPLLEEFLLKVRVPTDKKFVVGEVASYTTVQVVQR
jgi:hypothetical protein